MMHSDTDVAIATPEVEPEKEEEDTLKPYRGNAFRSLETTKKEFWVEKLNINQQITDKISMVLDQQERDLARVGRTSDQAAYVAQVKDIRAKTQEKIILILGEEKREQYMELVRQSGGYLWYNEGAK